MPLKLTQAPAFTSLLKSIISGPESELLAGVSAWLDAVLLSAQLVSRQTLADLSQQLARINDREIRKECLNQCLNQLQPRVTTFEEQVSAASLGSGSCGGATAADERTSLQVCTLRESYADLLEADEEFPEAAKVLIGIPLESSSR